MAEKGQQPPSRTFADGFRKGVAEGHTEGVRVGISMALAELRPIINRLEALAYDEAVEPEPKGAANVIPIKPP